MSVGRARRAGGPHHPRGRVMNAHAQPVTANEDGSKGVRDKRTISRRTEATRARYDRCGERLRLTLKALRQIAQDIATAYDPKLKVISAAMSSGGSAYVELTLTIEGCSVHPCTLIVGVDRTKDQAAIRTNIEHQLREHITRHRAGGT